MMHLRGSLGSPMGSPLFRPREAFQRLRDSSFWSVECYISMLLRAGVCSSWVRLVCRQVSPNVPGKEASGMNSGMNARNHADSKHT